jgi:hypothetical protein
MYAGKLTVTTPAADPSLTDLATVKDELAISGTDSDTRLTRWIKEESAAISLYVGRQLRAEDVVETFRSDYPYYADHFYSSYYHHHPLTQRTPAGLRLRRFPVVSIASVIADGTVLVANVDYELEADRGLLYRLTDSGSRIPWFGLAIAVTYTGGWAQVTDVPGNVQSAVQNAVAYRLSGRSLDPNVRSISIPGVMDKQYFVPPATATRLPPAVCAAVDYLRDVSV